MADLNEPTPPVPASPEAESVQLRIVAESQPAVKLGEASLRPDEMLTLRASDVILVDRWAEGARLVEGERVAFRMHEAVVLRGILVEVEGEVGVLIQQVLLQ